MSTDRHDRDSWDITTSVGATALFVAAARALEAGKASAVAVDPFAEVFCRAAGGPWEELMDGAARDHQLRTEFGDRFVDFQGARTRYFDDYFRAAAGAGVRQVVLLAAGLDSRAYRLRWPEHTVVYELDQPLVLEFKRTVLADYGAAPRSARVEVPVDLREDWPQALRDAGLDLRLPTAWIAEGLLIYLPADDQRQLFAGIDGLSAPGSHVAVEEATPMDADEFDAARAHELASGQGGTFFTLVYNQQHEPAGQWFGEHGWQGETTPLPRLLQTLGRPVPPPGSEEGRLTWNISLVSAVKDG
ncbi:class I SAM-dependent methyltransferase [Mycolicibacterium sp.]|uniref:class I SAM-dependent methyltransferase n=1 Tax=Mycolicibacterium sp. TaxID=2320850 RepID=UPI003D0A5E7C